MFRIVVRANHLSQMVAIVGSLRRGAIAHGLYADEIDTLCKEAAFTLSDLLGKARSAYERQEHYDAEQRLLGKRYDVRIVFGEGARRSMYRKAWEAITLVLTWPFDQKL